MADEIFEVALRDVRLGTREAFGRDFRPASIRQQARVSDAADEPGRGSGQERQD